MPDFVATPRYILALDTAMGGCSVAVLDTRLGRCVSETHRMDRGQSEILIPMVQEILERAGILFSDLGLIATTIGPGAFTGLRIGLSSARSLGLALNIPVAGVMTTESIAFSVAKNAINFNGILVVLETKREDFYVHGFPENPVAISKDDLLSKYQDRPLAICGDGVSRLCNEVDDQWPCAWRVQDGFDLPDPEAIAKIAWRDITEGCLRQAVPLYLRDADVSRSSRPARSIAGEQ